MSAVEASPLPADSVRARCNRAVTLLIALRTLACSNFPLESPDAFNVLVERCCNDVGTHVDAVLELFGDRTGFFVEEETSPHRGTGES